MTQKDRYLIISDNILTSFEGYKSVSYTDYKTYVKQNNFDILILEENNKLTVELLHVLSQLFLLNKEKIILLINKNTKQDDYITYLTLGITDILTIDQCLSELCEKIE